MGELLAVDDPAAWERAMHTVKVGLLGNDSTETYVNLLVDDRLHFSGMLGVIDVVELHPAFRLPAWPVSLRGT